MFGDKFIKSYYYIILYYIIGEIITGKSIYSDENVITLTHQLK